MFRAALLTFLIWGAEAASAEPFSLTPPAGGQYGRVVLAVVDHNRATPTGGCYQYTDDPGLCLPVYRGSAEIVRYLSPRPEGWREPGRFPQVRFLSGRSVRSIPPGLRLELLAQTEDSDLAVIWTASAEDDLVCLPPETIAQFRIRTSIRYRLGAEGESCFRLSAID